jgi:arylsulfatase A
VEAEAASVTQKHNFHCGTIMRIILSVSCRFLILFSLLFSVACADDKPNRPNIVLIVADDLGYGELGCYGQLIIKTPHIDELAQQGLRFTQFYCGSPVCAPSRCTLMTGKHTGHAAIRNNKQPKGLEKIREEYGWETPGQQPLPADEVTVAELLQKHGYVTAGIGKWGLGMPGTTGEPNRHGFDLFYGYLCQEHAHNHYPKFLWRNDAKEMLPGNNGTAKGQTYSQDRFTEEALQFVHQNRDKPFFLYLPFIIPHLSIQVPDEALAEYAGLAENPYPYKGTYFHHPTPHAGYAAMISYLDAAVGKIVASIDELGLRNNTLIIFTSDNGPTFKLGGADSDFFHSSGPLRGRKASAYEGGIRIPFIASWPGHIAAGKTSDQVAAFWDMLPTLCELTQIEHPSNIDGVSILPTLLAHGEQRQHEYLYWEFPAYAQPQAVRAGDWKIIRNGVDQGDPPFELYNLKDDVGEKQNVAADHPDVVARLTKYAQEAHTPSKIFPLLAGERPKGYKPVAARSTE